MTTTFSTGNDNENSSNTTPLPPTAASTTSTDNYAYDIPRPKAQQPQQSGLNSAQNSSTCNSHNKHRHQQPLQHSHSPKLTRTDIMWYLPDGAEQSETAVAFLIHINFLYLNGKKRPEANIKQQTSPPQSYDNHLVLMFNSGYCCNAKFCDEGEATHNFIKCQLIYEKYCKQQLPLPWNALQQLGLTQLPHPLQRQPEQQQQQQLQQQPQPPQRQRQPQPQQPNQPEQQRHNCEPTITLCPDLLETYTLDPLNTINWLSFPFTPLRIKWKKVSTMKWEMYFVPHISQPLVNGRI
jgi:hypothetical protein